MGLRVRHIQTHTVAELVDGAPVERIVPTLDEHGHEIELWSVDVPPEVEVNGGGAVDAYVAAQLAEREGRRAADQDKAIEKAFAAGTLPEDDRRASPPPAGTEE